MVAGTDRHAVLIEDGADIVRMDAVQGEREDARPVGSCADHAQAGDPRCLSAGVGEQRVLVGGDGFQADRAHVPDGGAKGDDAGDIGGARLELVGQLVVGGLAERDLANHVPAALVRRHGIEQRGLAVEHADAGGPVKLVPGERVEIAIEGLHVDLEVRHGLGAIDQHRDAMEMRQLDDVSHRVDGAKRVGEVRQRDQPGARAEQLRELLQHQLAGIVDRRHLQQGAGALARQLPRHDIGMVLHRADQDLVARAQTLAESCRHQVDRLGGAAHEHDFFAPGGVDQVSHCVARGLIGICGALAQGMHAAVDIGVERGIVMRFGIDHALRLLGGGGVVQIDQRLAVDGLAQDREILPQPLYLRAGDRQRLLHGHQFMRRRAHGSSFTGSGSRPRKSVSSRVRNGAGPSRLTTSSAKAKVSRARASASSIPRERR
ncbi:hypothetical protein D9M72_146200 [compost metagenome]